MSNDYDFSVDWFTPNWPNWLAVTRELSVNKILEVGSFEGRSTCTMIDEFAAKAPISIFCIDSWGGGVEHSKFDMGAIEDRFDRNVAIAQGNAAHPVVVQKCKGRSVEKLIWLLWGGHSASFDLVYIDGSHQAPDVITDLVLAYELCRIGGIIVCDDYLWSMEAQGKQDPLNMPKIAIDAFSTIFMRRIRQIGLPLYQVYFRKLG